jgi:hypothetical protein
LRKIALIILKERYAGLLHMLNLPYYVIGEVRAELHGLKTEIKPK